MPQPQSNELRVFISSTFRDLQEEREHLVKKVFPEIRALCRTRGVTFTEVDLRWGITEEEAERDGIIRICLDEIDRCRPYFIGILGQRYGWRPSRLDAERVVSDFPILADTLMEDASITEMEILHGVLANPAMTGHAFFYFRDRAATPGEFTDTDADSIARLDALKERIRGSGFPVQENFATPEELSAWIEDDLLRVINAEYPENQTPSALELERRAHHAFATSRRRAYVANPEYITQFNAFVSGGLEDSSIRNCLIVTGASGLGKSSLIAYLVEEYRNTHPTAFVIEHYVGASQASGSARSVMHHILEEIRERFAITDEIPSKPEELANTLPNWLFRAEHYANQHGIPMLVVIDAVNQLSDTEQELGWLPKNIPPTIQLIISATPGPSATRLTERGWRCLEVQQMDDRRVQAEIVRLYLREFRKGITDKQMMRLVLDAKAASPLYLPVVAEELRIHGEHETLDAVIDHYANASDLHGVFDRILQRLEQDYGQAAVENVMQAIWAARSGLSETELIAVTRLSRLELSRLLFAMDYHFVQREGLLGFSHSYFRRAVEHRYLSDPICRINIHQRLGEYFTERTSEAPEPLARDVQERAYHWHHANDSKRLMETLLTVPLFVAIWQGEAQYDVLRYWVWLRQQGYDPGPLYRQSLAHFEATNPDAQELCTMLSHADNLLGQLKHWDDALALLQRRKEIAAAAMLRYEEASAEGDIGGLLMLRGENNEALAHLERALIIFQELEDQVGMAKVKGNIGSVHIDRGDYLRALKYFEQALEIFQEQGDRSGVAITFDYIGGTYRYLSKYELALEYHRRSIEEYKELGDRRGVATNIGNIAIVHWSRGEYEQALDQFEAWQILSNDLGNRQQAVQAQTNKGFMYYNLRQFDRALECYDKALSDAQEFGDRKGIASITGMVGHVHLARGEYDRAIDCYQQEVAIYQEMGAHHSVTVTTGNMGFVFMQRYNYEHALECFETALDRHRESGFVYGVTYWLVGRATALMDSTEEATECPEFLLRFIGDTTVGTWQSVLYIQARQDAQECLDLSRSISKPDTEFGSQVLLARITAAEGEVAAALQTLEQLLSTLADDAEKADVHYWLWKMDKNGSKHHRDEALHLYQKLYQDTRTQQYRQRMEELESDK